MTVPVRHMHIGTPCHLSIFGKPVSIVFVVMCCLGVYVDVSFHFSLDMQINSCFSYWSVHVHVLLILRMERIQLNYSIMLGYISYRLFLVHVIAMVIILLVI